MLISHYEDAQDRHASGGEQPGSGQGAAGDGEWVDTAGNPPLNQEPGNTLGGWL